MRICDRCEGRNVEGRLIAIETQPVNPELSRPFENEWDPDLCDSCYTRLRKTIEDYLSPAKALRATEFNGP